MEELSIKIKIADREYPMKVKPGDEEKVRNAGRILNEEIKNYHDQFGLEDKQDLLAMVAFDSLIKKFDAETNSQESDESIIEKINDLNREISQIT